jgi:hypothetical protein
MGPDPNITFVCAHVPPSLDLATLDCGMIIEFETDV